MCSEVKASFGKSFRMFAALTLRRERWQTIRFTDLRNMPVLPQFSTQIRYIVLEGKQQPPITQCRLQSLTFPLLGAEKTLASADCGELQGGHGTFLNILTAQRLKSAPVCQWEMAQQGNESFGGFTALGEGSVRQRSGDGCGPRSVLVWPRTADGGRAW